MHMHNAHSQPFKLIHQLNSESLPGVVRSSAYVCVFNVYIICDALVLLYIDFWSSVRSYFVKFYCIKATVCVKWEFVV